MARITHRLTAIKAAAIKAKGLHHDGDGLYLRVTATGSKSWILRYTLNGVTRDMGLGPYPNISLAAARQQATAQRELVGRRIDPLEARKSAIAADRLAALASSPSASAQKPCSSRTRAPGATRSTGSSGATP